ncbi:MAG: ATP-binding protein [Desulfobulbaceae bacterium]|nr:ATP-binding protein [Desulfobulbaceae bacterium]HIJ90319.1 response regulator [Deltaproteobacteria bacterium]
MITTKTITILMIEDERLTADLMIKILTMYGGDQVVVLHADTLAGGLQIVADGGVDLVLLDLNLPDSAGLSTLRKLHDATSDIAIIVLTGMRDESLAIQALQMGAQDYLMKGDINGPFLLKTLRYSLERKQFQEELKKHQAQMIQYEKMASIGQLAAGVAHEINNPIGFISSNLSSLDKYVERLLEFIELLSAQSVQSSNGGGAGEVIAAKRRELKIDFISNDIKTLIAESLQGTERVKHIVQDLKNFSRDEQDTATFEDINDILESTLNMVWNELKYKVTLKKEFGSLPKTRCNPMQLSQVFVNLLVNAAHSIAHQGDIIVKTWQESGGIYVTITDTGCGIPENILPRVFDPFFTTKEVGKGTGLGLSIAYEIITKKHNGEITVASKVGKGSTFSIKIPVVEE